MYRLSMRRYNNGTKRMDTITLEDFDNKEEAFWSLVKSAAATDNLASAFHMERIRREFMEYGNASCNGYVLAEVVSDHVSAMREN